MQVLLIHSEQKEGIEELLIEKKERIFFQQSRNPISSLIIKWEKAKRVEDNTLNNSHQNKRLGYPKK